MDQNSLKGKTVTPAKLRRILRWARNRRFALKIVSEYNNSLGDNTYREYFGRIQDFSVESYGPEFAVHIEFDTGEKMRE